MINWNDYKVWDKKKQEVAYHGSLDECENFLKEIEETGKAKTAFGHYAGDAENLFVLPKDVIVLK